MPFSFSYWASEPQAIRRLRRARERRLSRRDLAALPEQERELVTGYLTDGEIVPELEGIFSRLVRSAERDLLLAAYERLIQPPARTEVPEHPKHVAWLRALLSVKEHGFSIDVETLDFWWQEMADALGILPAHRAEAIDRIVDLSTGPAPGQQARRMERVGLVETTPAGVVQETFLVSPFGAGKSRADQLEQFAKSIAGDDTRLDGVIALAGVRGSGKSTALNYVEEVCRSAEGQRPLVVRIDLSAAFEPVQFARDFVDLVARDARLHVETNTSYPWIRRLNLLLGHCAAWCQTNLGWAILAAVLLASVIGISHCYLGLARKQTLSEEVKRLDSTALAASERVVASLERVRTMSSTTSDDADLQQARGLRDRARAALERADADAERAHKRLDAVSERLDAPEPIDLVLVGKQTARDIHAVFLTLLLVLAMGSAHAVRSLREHRPYSKRTRAGIISVLLVVCVALLAVGSAMDWLNQTERMRSLWRLPFSTSAASVGEHWSTSLLLPYGVSLILLTLAILCLPRWWDYYLRFQHVRKSVRTAGLSQIPQVGNLLGPLGQLLPQRDDPNDIDEQSLPFVQRQAREVLQRAVDAFGSVVLLVDDVDMLPANDFPELLRALRPVIKVPRACCLLAVPLFFYDALQSISTSDLHSTLRQCLVLGDPELFGSERENFAVRDDASRGQLWDTLLMLLRARLVVTLRLPPPISAGAHAASGLRDCRFFGELLQRWGFEPTSTDEPLRERERILLDAFGQSRREILRVLAQRAPGEVALGVPVDIRRHQAYWRDSLRHRRRVYAEAESLISTRV
jgi:hypothetical protein